MRKFFTCLSLATIPLITGCPSDDAPSDEEIGETGTDSTGDGDGDTNTESSDSSSDDTTTDDTTTDDTTTDETTTDDTTTDGPVCGDGAVDDGEECDDGNAVDGDACTNACTNAVCGDSIVQEGVEGCDDGNDVDGDGCSACALESCGDGVIQGMEACDDGNDVDSDECTSLCTVAACGDGFVQEGMEECDDGNDLDSDECLVGCVAASCGDGFVFEGMEECDDDNDVDTDECLNACTIAACGDSVVQDGIEACDDGNIEPMDGCDDACQLEIKPNLLRCGVSDRDVAAFIPMGVNLTVVASCTPDANTQAMLVTRNGAGLFNAAGLKTWVEGGGIVLTEVFASDDVYNAVFNAGVVETGFFGSCTDVAPTVAQFSNMDPFWVDNPFQAITLGQSGCGRNVDNYPGLIKLAGWAVGQTSIGYRDAGAGRVWVTEFDWQDNGSQGAVFDYTAALMGYMILNGQ